MPNYALRKGTMEEEKPKKKRNRAPEGKWSRIMNKTYRKNKQLSDESIKRVLEHRGIKVK